MRATERIARNCQCLCARTRNGGGEGYAYRTVCPGCEGRCAGVGLGEVAAGTDARNIQHRRTTVGEGYTLCRTRRPVRLRCKSEACGRETYGGCCRRQNTQVDAGLIVDLVRLGGAVVGVNNHLHRHAP